MTGTVLNALKCVISFHPHIILFYRNYYYLLLYRWGYWNLERLSVWNWGWNLRSLSQESRFNNHIEELWLVTYMLFTKQGYFLINYLFFFNVTLLDVLKLNNKFHNFKVYRTCAMAYLLTWNCAGNRYSCFFGKSSPISNFTSL